MPYNPIKVGSDEPQLQHYEDSFSVASGTRTSREYIGLNLAKMSTLAASFIGWDSKLRFGGNVATLTLTKSGTTSGGGSSPYSDITDKWELGVDNERPEIFDHPNLINSVKQYDGVTILGEQVNISEQIFACMRASSGNTAAGFVARAEATFIMTPSGQKSAATVKTYLSQIYQNYGNEFVIFRLFLNDYLRGQTSFLRGKYVLRHTTLAPNNYSANVADFNVEKVYSIGQLLSETQSSFYWILPLPSYLAFKIANYPALNVPTQNRYWGALKSRSNAVLAAQGRIEITTEYLIDSWPLHTYGYAY